MPGSPIDQAPDALDYLLQRGITKETAMSCGVCYEAQWRLGGESRRAVLFPVTDAEGGLVAVHGRYVDGGTPKSRTSGPKSQGMFATPGALAAPVFAVTEAPLDALALAQLQKLPAMALIGTSWPTWLRRHVLGRTVLLATDNDAAGDACATTLESELQSFGARAKRFRAPYPAKDWNEALDHTRMHWTAAPRREDFPEDSAAWTALLRSTYERPERPAKGIDELLAALHTARCFGTRLDYDGHRWRLVPRDPGDPVVDVDIEYGQLRERYLMPHAAKIKEILAGLATPDGLTVDPSLS